MIPALEQVGFHSQQAGPPRPDTILSPFSEQFCLGHTEDLSSRQHVRAEVSLVAGFLFKPFTAELRLLSMCREVLRTLLTSETVLGSL